MPERADLDRQLAERELTQPQYFDACKLIARRDDLRFLIRVAGADLRRWAATVCLGPKGAILADASDLLAQLEQRKATGADITAINSLRDRYRISKGSLKVEAGSPESLRREAERESWREAA